MEVASGLIDEIKINGEKLEGDLRSILDEKKKVLSLQQTEKEVTLPTSFNSEKNSVEKVDAPGPLLIAAASGNKDTETMLPGTLTSKISEQLGMTTTNSSTPAHIDVEAQNNIDNNSRQLIVISQIATEQLSSRFVKNRELDSLNAVVVTKSTQDEAKKGNTTAEKSSNQWTLVSHKKTIDSKSSNNNILHQKDFTHVEFDRSNSVIECTQFDVLRDEKFGQYEGLHVTDELVAESGNTLDFDKQIEETGKLKQCTHDEHTNQQALVTHEKEFIVTEKIDGKEINLNTPTVKNEGESASRWADLVEEENHTPSPSRSKLSPQALEFVPTSKTNPSMTVIGTSSNLSATKVNVADRDILYDLDNDMSDGYNEDDEEEMLDICFDKVAKEGDLSPRQQRSGSTKCKKKTHRRQQS
ncbi:hypothetical protein H5410_032800 [Solanum commersonii]|uniref:NB-ARC domain containing protein n=1 Tax=Solanum commersonii TaxID=4109 RepID=A0A9J5YRA6_SOLCO|nr:hypothetical protein H5410_032800 [Solanum commersonii]